MSDDWQSFFGAMVPASSALLGLLFVSLSLNLQAILAQPILPSRALLALLQLFSVLFVALLVLVPELPFWVLALNLALVAVICGSLGTHVAMKTLSLFPTDRISPSINMALAALSALVFLTAAWRLASGDDSGYFWIAGAMLISLVKAVLDAWVLLVEINR